MTFNLRPQDHQLIAAAIAFGDWLAVHPRATAAQVQIIRELQGILRRVPEDSSDVLDLSYALSVSTGSGPWDETTSVPRDEWKGVNRSWTVFFGRGQRGMPGHVEIFNHVNYWPAIDELEEMQEEHCCDMVAGGTNSHEGESRKLVEELLHPVALIPADATVEVVVIKDAERL